MGCGASLGCRACTRGGAGLDCDSAPAPACASGPRRPPASGRTPAPGHSAFTFTFTVGAGRTATA
jgi:hypothetical protein